MAYHNIFSTTVNWETNTPCCEELALDSLRLGCIESQSGCIGDLRSSHQTKQSELRTGGGDTLTIQARAYARFQIVSVLGKEIWAYAIYTRDQRRSFCAWVVFLAKTGGTLSWTAAIICSASVYPFYRVEIVHLNVEFSCNCMKCT